MDARSWRWVGLLLTGLGLGVLLMLVASYVFYRSVAEYQTEERLLRRLRLPDETLRLESLEGDSVARVVARDVLIRGRGGDTIVFAPTVRFRLHLPTVGGRGPIVLSQVVVSDPYLNLVQQPDGEFNLSQTLVVTAGGREVLPEEETAGFLLRDLQVADGRVRIVTPWVPDSLPVRADRRAQVRLAQRGGATVRLRGASDLDARLRNVRFGGDRGGWRAEVVALTAQLTDPAVRLLAMRGLFQSDREGEFDFRLDELRAGGSAVDGAGTVRYAGEQLRYQVQLRARPVEFADLQWLVPALPAGGRVEGVFAFQTRAGERVEARGADVVVTAQGSRVAGRFSALMGGGAPAVFWDTELRLDPLRLETLDALGIGDSLPYTGEVRGVVASVGEGTAGAAALRVDLTAGFTPSAGDLPTSTVVADGNLVLGGPAGMRLDGVRVALQPLHLAALRPLAPAQAERLQGVLRGTLVVSGTSQLLRVRDGDLAYEVGGAPPSRLTGLDLQLEPGERPRFVLEARAEPLALATLKALYPALPFEAARFTGPIRVTGTADQIQLNVELAGSPGRFTLRGAVRPGTPLRFDLQGSLDAFNPEAVVTRPVAVDGPLTGTFSLNGAATDFRFGVNMTQPDGRFALQGRVRQPETGTRIFEVAGDVTNFNLGALIGRPQLFASRMTGRIELTGGGRDPYRFVTDLRGTAGAFDVRGAFVPGDIPSYSLSGSIAGLNVQQLPGGQALPATSLTGTVSLQGRGTTPETLEGSLRLDANGSTVAGMPVTNLLARVTARQGVLVVDTVDAVLAGARLSAEGTLGLTRPVATPLSYRLVARDLSQLAPLFPTDRGVPRPIAGSLVIQGTVAGSLRSPLVAADFRGQGLRYDGWQAARLQFNTRLDLSGGFANLRGRLDLQGERMVLAGRTSLDTLRLVMDGTAERMAVRLNLARQAGSNIQLAGVVQLADRSPRGVVLDSLQVRAGAATWQLANQAEVRWGGVEGVFINNLLLRRVGDEQGTVLVHGTLPPTGDASLRVAVRNLDLDVVRRTLPSAPELEGVISLDALLQGPVADPELVVQGRAHAFRFRGFAADSVVLGARYDERRLVSNAGVWRSNLRLAVMDATVPMRLALENTLPRFELLRNEPLTARLVSDSLPLAFVTALSPQVQDVQGTMQAQVTASGTIARPSVSGWAILDNGAITVPQTGVRYERISGRLSLDDQLVRVDSLRVWSDGSALLNGTIRLTSLDRPEVYLTATLNGFKAVEHRDLADLVVGGNLALSGQMPSPVLTGQLRLEQGVIYIPTLNDQLPVDITGLDIGQIGADTATVVGVGPGMMGNVQVQDLTVVVEEGVWLQSEDARVEITGELVIVKTGQQTPKIFGNLQAVRGRYALTIGPLVREFDVVGGSVRFFGTPDLNPELDITAQHEVGATNSPHGGLAILVRLTGTLEYPRVTLTSNTRPPLPESELLNYLVFGGPSFQSALAGNSTTGPGGFAQQVLVQELLGGLLIQELSQLLPCQYFRLRGHPLSALGQGNAFGGLSSTSVECGVQIATNLFLTLETGPGLVGGLTGGSSLISPQFAMSLEWRASEHLTVRVAREPVRAGLSTMILTPVDVGQQWSAEVRGTWEFARPRSQAPLEPDSTPGRLPGVVAPVPPAPGEPQPQAPPRPTPVPTQPREQVPARGARTTGSPD